MSSLVAQTQSSAVEVRTQDKLPHLSRETGVRLPPPPSQQHTPKLPAAADNPGGAASTESLIEALGLAEADEASLGSLLKTVRGEVLSTLEELQTITTHDDNLEKQYKEVSSDNTKLHAALEKARREIRHLKGQLSILQMTSPEIREERARTQLRRRRRAEQERKVQLQRMRSQYADGTLPVLTAAERARTVNARGEYVDHHVPQGSKKSRHLRRATYPPPRPLSPPVSSAFAPQSGPKSDPLPPPLSGCSCSVCNAKQSLGALTLGKALKQQQTTNQHTRSGQQILLGDRVIVKGERPGTVRYIGKLDFDILDLVYIGVHLDTPVGTCDGSLKGRQYFQCPPNHGVFVRPSDVMCVTGRKPQTGGTAVPRIRERLPTGLEINRTTSQASKTLARDSNQHSFPTSPPPSSLHTTPTIAHARATVEAELEMLRKRHPNELADESVVQMSERIKALAKKSHQPQMKSSPTPAPTILSMPHPPPRPLNPEPTLPETPPPPPEVTHPPPPEVTRPPSPLETTLLQLLSKKDLGGTGFVTATELAATLMQLEPDKALTPSEIDQLFFSLGLDANEGGGIPYHQTIPQIVHTVNNIRQERPN